MLKVWPQVQETLVLVWHKDKFFLHFFLQKVNIRLLNGSVENLFEGNRARNARPFGSLNKCKKWSEVTSFNEVRIYEWLVIVHTCQEASLSEP